MAQGRWATALKLGISWVQTLFSLLMNVTILSRLPDPSEPQSLHLWSGLAVLFIWLWRLNEILSTCHVPGGCFYKMNKIYLLHQVFQTSYWYLLWRKFTNATPNNKRLSSQHWEGKSPDFEEEWTEDQTCKYSTILTAEPRSTHMGARFVRILRLLVRFNFSHDKMSGKKFNAERRITRL